MIKLIRNMCSDAPVGLTLTTYKTYDLPGSSIVESILKMLGDSMSLQIKMEYDTKLFNTIDPSAMDELFVQIFHLFQLNQSKYHLESHFITNN